MKEPHNKIFNKSSPKGNRIPWKLNKTKSLFSKSQKMVTHTHKLEEVIISILMFEIPK